MQIIIVVLILFLSFSPVWSLNMEKFGSHTPDFFVHSLDVEIDGDKAYVTGYGGLMMYDISDNDVNYINRFTYGGGRGIPFYNCRVADDIAYVTARGSGFYIVNVSDPRQPSLITRLTFQDASPEDCDILGDLLALTMHGNGIIFYDISNRNDPQVITALDDLENCWSVLFIDEENLIAADGEGGLVMISFVDENPEIVSRLETSGAAIDIRIDGDLCAVAVGAAGVDLFNISNLEEPAFITNFDTPTYAGHIGLDGDLVAIADWNEVLVYDVSDPENPVLDGRRYTEGRAMGVDIQGSSVYLADWSPFIGYAYGEIDGPDINFSTRRIVPVGDGVIDTSLLVYNLGHSELEVLSISSDAQQFSVDPDEFDLGAGEEIEIAFSYQPLDGRSNNMQFSSNDGDENRATIKLEGLGGLAEGDLAPDFTMPLLGGGQYRLSDQRDRVQLLIFWASW
ncbi:hypothetical protein HQ587_02000 [bacterium]|nr:hypothetical protein [bacterium]